MTLIVITKTTYLKKKQTAIVAQLRIPKAQLSVSGEICDATVISMKDVSFTTYMQNSSTLVVQQATLEDFVLKTFFR